MASNYVKLKQLMFIVSGNDTATHGRLNICVFQNDCNCHVFFVICQINARKWIKFHGKLKKSDPNSIRQDKVNGDKRKIGESSGERGVTQISSSGHEGTCFLFSFPVLSWSVLH